MEGEGDPTVPPSLVANIRNEETALRQGRLGVESIFEYMDDGVVL